MPDGERAAYALVLAAGAGTRFGGGKLLASYQGRALIAHAATAVAEAIGAGVLAGGVAVVPEGDTALGWHLDPAGLVLVPNPRAGSGLASSLQCGLAALESEALRPAADAAVVILGDQPMTRADVIARLVTEWRRTGTSVRPRYAGAPDLPGHPVLIDRTLWRYAGRLQGESGFAELLRERPVTLVDVPGLNPDVDTPDDLDLLEEH